MPVAENKHLRFMKEFSFHEPYGKSKFLRQSAEGTDWEKLTKLVDICCICCRPKYISSGVNVHAMNQVK
jgi:hypothetical protein